MCVIMARDFAKQFYRSKQWEQCREAVLMRDRYLCVECGAPAEEVHHVIHLSPQNINDPAVAINPLNLKSLCKACHFDAHKSEHGLGRQAQEDYPYTFNDKGELIKKPDSPL